MGRTKMTASIPHAGVKHNTSSARTHDNSSLGLDWFWLLLALLAVAAIVLR
jgi:hypothetical protein